MLADGGDSLCSWSASTALFVHIRLWKYKSHRLTFLYRLHPAYQMCHILFIHLFFLTESHH